MNKRQRKKKDKKHIPVSADENNLLLMTDEEREKAVSDFKKYVNQYAYRKKYSELKGKPLVCYYPVGNKINDSLKQIFSRGRKGRTTVVTQNLQGICR